MVQHYDQHISSIFWSSVSIRHPLDGVSVVCEVHDRNAGQLPDPPLEVLVAGCYDVGLVLRHPVHQAVVSVGTLNQVKLQKSY